MKHNLTGIVKFTSFDEWYKATRLSDMTKMKVAKSCTVEERLDQGGRLQSIRFCAGSGPMNYVIAINHGFLLYAVTDPRHAGDFWRSLPAIDELNAYFTDLSASSPDLDTEE